MNPSGTVADKVIGIIIMILSGCGAACGIALTAGLGLGGLALSGAAASEGGADAAQAATAAGFFGLAGAALGMMVFGMMIVSFFVGFGIFKSARWGFIVGSAWYGLITALNVVQFELRGGLGLLISGCLCVYCVLRLTGNIGSKPA